MINVAKETCRNANIIRRKQKLTNINIVYAACFRHQLNQLIAYNNQLYNIHFDHFTVDFERGFILNNPANFKGRRFNCKLPEI